MLADHEAAWQKLAAYIASKPHHGSTDLLAEMTRVMADPDIRVSESGLARALRLYGVEVDLEALSAAIRDGASDAGGGSPAAGDGGSPRPSPTHDPGRDHDGSSDTHARGRELAGHAGPAA